MLTFKNISLKPLKESIKQFNKRRVGAAAYERFEICNPGEYKSMNCFHYYKCIFVHIPKTGGKSVSKTLFGNFSGGHSQVTKYIKLFGESTFLRYYKFAFVRNPWDRLFSAYNYFEKGAKDYLKDEKWNVEHVFYNQNLSHLASFEQFVMEWVDEKVVTSNMVHFIPQHHMITTIANRDKIMVDFVGRFENIDEDFKALCIKLNRRPMQLQQINVSGHAKNSFINAYTNEMIDKVAKLYKKDIELFGYSFPS